VVIGVPNRAVDVARGVPLGHPPDVFHPGQSVTSPGRNSNGTTSTRAGTSVQPIASSLTPMCSAWA
jgi:hypothetical protein